MITMDSMISLKSPGTYCLDVAIKDLLKNLSLQSFIEIGCGNGNLSKLLCQSGLKGCGVDVSAQAIAIAENKLKNFIDKQQYQLIHSSLLGLTENYQADLAISLMVMEHVDDDVDFLTRLSKLVKPSGYVMVGVPARKNKWSLEDDLVGHVRRYDREDLIALMKKIGLKDITCYSVSYPISNILLPIGNLYTRRTKAEMNKMFLESEIQTQLSGVRSIPYKTVFPIWYKLLLNSFTMLPLVWLQKLFYSSNLGLSLVARGRVQE